MLGNANAIGIPFNGNNQFSPSSIKDANGNSLLKQQLFKSTLPTLGGTIFDEKTNQGSARTIQQGRAYMFDGVDDYVATTLNLNTFCKDTFHIDLWIDPTDGQPALDQAVLGAMDASTFGSQGSGANNGITIALFTTGKLYWAYKANGNFARADSASAIFVNGAQPAPRKFRFSATAGVGLTISEWNGSAWVAIPLDATFNGLFSTNNVVMSSFNYNANLFFGNRNANGTPLLWFAGELFGLEVMNSSLVDYAFYKCDEQAGIMAYDSSGNNRHGTITGATLSTFHNTQNIYSWQNEVGYSQYMLFDGVDDEITHANNSAFNAGSGDFEIRASIIRDSSISTSELIVSKGKAGAGGKRYLLFINSSGKAVLSIDDDTTAQTVTGTSTITDNRKHRIVGRRIGTDIQIEVDGIVEATTAIGTYGNIDDTSTPFDIGGKSDVSLTAETFFKGIIYNVSFYKNSVLTYSSLGYGNANSNWTDQVGSNNGTVVGSPSNILLPRNEAITTQDVSGESILFTGQVPYNGKLKQANCLTFNGTSQYASIPDNAAFDISNNLSVSIRAKSRVSPVVGQDVLFCKYDSGANQREWYIEYQSDNNVKVNLSQNGTTGAGNFVQYTTTSPITITNENTIGFTFASGTFKLYVNGVSVPTSIISGAPISTIYNGTAPVLIGVVTSSGTPANHFDGNLWDARIYKNTVLTDAEMLQIHNGTETTLSATPVAHYPMSAGAGTVLYDVIAGLDGTLINAPTNAQQETYHYNMVRGCSKYMNFDSVNDYVSVADNAAFKITNNLSVSIKTKHNLSTLSTHQYPITKWEENLSRREWLLAIDNTNKPYVAISGNGITFGVYSATNAINPYLPTTLGFTFASGTVTLYVNGVAVAGSVTSGSIPSAIFNGTGSVGIGVVNIILGTPVGRLWNGTLWDARIYSGTILSASDMLALHNNQQISPTPVARWEGTGNTNNDWLDKVGTNNGTVVGSPVNIFIPAKTSTTDVFNAPLRNPAGAYHNGSESVIDFRNSVNSPVAVINNWETAWAFNTARTNPEFKRTLTSGGLDHRADRFLGYNETLSGTNLTKVQNYTATKAI